MDTDEVLDDNSDCDVECDSTGCLPPYYQRLRDQSVHNDSIYPQPELKVCDTGIGGVGVTTFPVDNIGVVASLSAQLQNGTGNLRFLGNQITVKSLSWNFFPIPPTTTPPNVLKVSFVWDRQPNGAVAAYSDIYTSSGTGAITNSFRHVNYNNSQRFVILKTFVYPCPLNGGTNYETGKLSIDMVSTYGPQTTMLPPITGGLLVAAVCTATSGGNLYGYCRIRYYDN